MLDRTHLPRRRRTLGLHAGDYAAFGSGPLAARGIAEHAREADVVARGAAWAEARGLGPVGVASAGDRVVRAGGDVEVFVGMMGFDAGVTIDCAGIAGGAPFARLEGTPAFERALERLKGREHIRPVEEHPCERRRGGRG